MNYYLSGNFIIDKNINKGNYAPTSFLIPEPKYQFIDARNLKGNLPHFTQKNDEVNYDSSKTDYSDFNDKTCKNQINFIDFKYKKIIKLLKRCKISTS